MPAVPWFGFWRGLLFAAMPGIRYPGEAVDDPSWLSAAKRRRRVLLASVLLFGALAWWYGPREGHPVPLALQTLLLAWIGAGCVTAMAGAWVLMRGDPHALEPATERVPVDARARTAIVMPICNEEIATVFAGLRATCESLASTGALRLFDIYILSDTTDPALRAAEMRAWLRLRNILGDPADTATGRLFYRWRRRRSRRKAGNVADFCRRWGSRYRYMIVLDADSTMRGDTLVSMVRMMEAHPRVGILQTLPQAVGHDTLHARMQQFTTRVTGRLFALGMAWWQLGESHYWGHNAILRVEPFMRHCGLAPLPGRGGLSGDILSHDFVEAALMRRAGYEVWLAPTLGGSWEQPPPNVIAELQRDRRWCQGNLQNIRLIAEPGWRPVHRVMFLTGALSYAVAPLWLAYVVLDAWLGIGGGTPVMWLLTAVALLTPRALGVLTVWLAGRQREFGGTAKLAAGAVLEVGLSALQAPLRLLAHSSFVIGALTGLRLDWKSPPREAGAVTWRDAAGRVGLLAVPALIATLAVVAVQGPAWHVGPLLLPLLLAIPFTVWSGNPGVGAALRRRGWLNVLEEHQLPHTLARAGDHRHFADLMPTAGATASAGASLTVLPAAVSGQPAMPLATRLAFWRAPGAPSAARRGGFALAAVMLMGLAVLPREGATPTTPMAWLEDAERVESVQTASEFQSSRTEPSRVAWRPSARVVRYTGPASRIDNAVRQRAAAYVAQALSVPEEES